MENVVDSSFTPVRSWLSSLVFKHLVEILVFSGLLLLLAVTFIPGYEKGREKSQIAVSYQTIQSLVNALQIYQFDNPESRIFPPDFETLYPGIGLCPIQDTEPERLVFLTKPDALLKEPPIDPFMTQVVEPKRSQAPVTLHWVKPTRFTSELAEDYEHVAWGALSVGPSLQLPPQYDITVLRKVPYETKPLRSNLFDPTNGAKSMGLIYYDSLGNTTKIKE